MALLVTMSGNHFVGTIKTNKIGLPNDGKFPKTGPGKKQRGILKQMVSTWNGMACYFTAWMDKKPVHLLSTIMSKASTCFHQVKQGAEAAATWSRVQFLIPSIIKVYNKFMGGTDGFDWRIAAFRPKIITKSWVPKVLCHLLNAAMVNSYLIYKWHYGKLGELNEERFHLSEYVKIIMNELADEYIQSKVLITGLIVQETNTRSKASWNKDRFRRVGAHFPVQNMISSESSREASDNKYRRRKCIMCHRKVSYQCEQCGVFLCLDAPTGKANCWKQFHTEKDIMHCLHHTTN